jgi:transposase
MQERSKIHVGLDVHKDSISVAAAEAGRAPGRLIGKVTHDVNKLLKVLAKVGTAEQLHIVYEAGPTGFRLQRAPEGQGLHLRDHCSIADPAAPRRSSQDRRA